MYGKKGQRTEAHFWAGTASIRVPNQEESDLFRKREITCYSNVTNSNSFQSLKPFIFSVRGVLKQARLQGEYYEHGWQKCQ